MASAENTTPKTTKAASDKVAPRQQSAVSNLTLGNADDALSLAKELQKFVKANNLTTKIQNKDLPNVEAWQFAGSLLGLSPMLESIEDKSTPDEIKWNATVNLLSIKTGNVVGRGFATCSNKENTKKFFADYAICSMAQTRAVGKAYRLSLGWLMKAAGYEATPAEEMSDVGTEASVVESPKKPAAEASAPASESQAASAGAALSRGDEAALILAFVAQIEATESLLALKKLWDSEAIKPYKKELEQEKNAAKVRLEKAAATSVGPVITEPANRPEINAQGIRMSYATGAQKQEVIRQLNHPAIDRPTKTVGIVAMNRWSEELAEAKIAYYQHLIDEQENTPLRERVARDLRAWARDEVYFKRLHAKYAEGLIGLCNQASIPVEELEAEWVKARTGFPEPLATAA